MHETYRPPIRSSYNNLLLHTTFAADGGADSPAPAPAPAPLPGHGPLPMLVPSSSRSAPLRWEESSFSLQSIILLDSCHGPQTGSQYRECSASSYSLLGVENVEQVYLCNHTKPMGQKIWEKTLHCLKAYSVTTVPLRASRSIPISTAIFGGIQSLQTLSA